MGDPCTVPSRLSAHDAEEFFTSGTPAYPAETLTIHEVGVDVPGVGRLDAAGAPLVAVGRAYTPGEVPPSLYTHLRDGVLSQLIFAAKDLAQSLTTRQQEPWCLSCGDMLSRHYPGCRVARVLGLLGDLENLEINRKETAPDEGRGCVGFGRSSRGPLGEPWQYRVDQVLQITNIYDCDGALLVSIDRADTSAATLAGRIVDCVNSSVETEEEVGAYGEPWRAVNSGAGAFWILDAEDRPIARTVSASPRENQEWADRIVAAINSAKHVPDAILTGSVSKNGARQ